MFNQKLNSLHVYIYIYTYILYIYIYTYIYIYIHNIYIYRYASIRTCLKSITTWHAGSTECGEPTIRSKGQLPLQTFWTLQLLIVRGIAVDPRVKIIAKWCITLYNLLFHINLIYIYIYTYDIHAPVHIHITYLYLYIHIWICIYIYIDITLLPSSNRIRPAQLP